MDLSKFFIYSGRFIITFFLIAIFIASIGELYYQNSASLSVDSSSQLFLNNLLQNINSKPLASLSLTDPNTACSIGSSVNLAYYETGSYCECNMTVYDQCTEDQLNQGCTMKDSEELGMDVWKAKTFCQTFETSWNYSTRDGACEENMTYCGNGICVSSDHACPITDILISDENLTASFTNIGNISGNYTVWTSSRENSSSVIDLFVGQAQNSSCYNDELIFYKNGSESLCLSYEDDEVYRTLDSETLGGFYQDNNITVQWDETSNSSNSSIYLLSTKKVQVYSEGYCVYLNGMGALTISSDFDDYDSYRLISVATGIAGSVVGLILFFIYLCVMRATTSSYKKDRRSFVFFWILHILGIVVSVVILVYDYLSYDFLISLEDSNALLYEIEAGNCFGEELYQSFLTTLVDDIQNYYSTREDWMEIGLIFSAAFIVFEGFYLTWFACGYKCSENINHAESEADMTDHEANQN